MERLHTIMKTFSSLLCTALFALALARSAAAQNAASAPPNPCPADKDRHRLDFWIGEWDVVTTQGNPAGHSVVQSVAGGCGLLENWTDSGAGPVVGEDQAVVVHRSGIRAWLGAASGTVRSPALEP